MADVQFSNLEKDILQELMNIGFGQAAADLAQVIDLSIELSVPDIQLFKASDLRDHIANEVDSETEFSLVEQYFLGKFKGIALLVFPAKAGKQLVSLFGLQDQRNAPSERLELLEKEAMIEVGNILIGACVGKITELLNDVVIYSPPRVMIQDVCNSTLPKNLFDPDSMAISMKTVFHFEQQEISGQLFLIANHESISWLKTALHAFMEQYE
ncbi:chemotaxis protein CheC [Syntrophotalea acetylenivorans]|nr:chemotaxis protein CheC [Syntrophotalea acetylenivorans]